MSQHIEDLFIILVEPSLTQRAIIEKQFQELNIKHYKYVDGGQEAIELCRNDMPDLVISAMHLPDMTCTEMLTIMRQDTDMIDLHVMLISTETNFEVLDPVKQAGATALLPKPFTTQQLKKALHTNLELNSDRVHLDSIDVESMNVLVVDDSRFARRQIIRTLRSMGMEKFTEAENGEDAIPKLNKEYFDLVVTDYNMPKMDGKHLIDFIRKQSQQQTVPVLMVTTEENMSKLSAVEQSGVSAICDKPFEPATVKSLIEAVMAA